MGFFGLFGHKRAPDHSQGANPRASRTPEVDGLTPETAIKLHPPDDSAKVRVMREAAKEYMKKRAIDNDALQDFDSIRQSLGPVDFNRALDTIAAEGMREILLEKMFGKEGVSWKSGMMIMHTNTLQSLEIVFNDGSKKYMYFDYSEYDTLADHIP